MNPSDIRTGVVVRGPKWSGDMQIHSAERTGPYIRIIGHIKDTAIDAIFTQSDIQQMEAADISGDGAGDPQRAFLAIEAMRCQLSDDPLMGLHASVMNPLPHQIEAVYNYALQWPRVRFMFAHVAGTGKTVMAALIIKEMRLRRTARQTLVVAPAHLHEHWRRELAERSGQECDIADRNPERYVRRPWKGAGVVIASAKFIEQEDVMPYLETSAPDAIIIDEAHALPRRHAMADGRSLGNVLAAMSQHILLLTATPPPAGSPQLAELLDMLEPGFLANPDMMRESIDAADNPLVLRRTTHTMTDITGAPLFGRRIIKTLSVAPSQVEDLFQGAVRDYLKRYPDTHTARCASSGVYAVLQAMERRSRHIKDSMHDYAKPDKETSENAEEQARVLDRLITMARRVLDSDSEQKISDLHRALRGLEGAKALIVTESYDTLQYIKGRVASWGYDVCTMHDKMTYEDRLNAEHAFRDKADIMVAAETSEGANLQFCRNMINYDLPWESHAISRRMAWLRRYETAADTSILNMVVTGTPHGQVLKAVLDRFERMEDDAAFDYVGEALGDALRDVMQDTVSGIREPRDAIRDLEVVMDEWYHRQWQRGISEGLNAQSMDLAALSAMIEDSRTHKAYPEYAGDALGRALDILGGKVRRRPDGLDAIDYIPPALHHAKTPMPDGYPKITFDPDLGSDADMVSPGHPMHEAVAEWISKECTHDAQRGALFTDPDGMMDGYILFHRLDVKDVMGDVAGEKLVAHYVGERGNDVRYLHPTILWDLQAGGQSDGKFDIDAAQSRAAASVYATAERYRDELLMDRRRQAEAYERYGLASLDYTMQNTAGSDANQKHRDELAHRMRCRQELSICTPHTVAWVKVVPGAAESPNPRIHASGVKTAMAYERRCGRLPVDVSGHAMGYDIESRDAEGRARYVAVRAREGVGGVSITPNELRVARNTGSDYYLYVVYDGNMARIPDPGHTVTVRRGDIRHAISYQDIQDMAESDA